MNAQLLQLLLGFDRRLAAVIVAAMVFLIGFEGWQLVLREPVAEYRSLLQSRALAVQAAHDYASIPQDAQRLRTEVDAMEKTLAQDPLVGMPEGQQSAALMGQLDRIAHDARIQLMGVHPGAAAHGQAFNSISLDLESRGRYADLMVWLNRAETELGPLVVKRFQITRHTPDDSRLDMRLGVATFRPNGDSRSEP